MRYVSQKPFRKLTDNLKQSGGPPIARRSFIRNIAVASLGAAAALGGARNVQAKSKEEGEITLDAILITYFTATIGATGSSVWSLEGEYSTTFRLASHEDPLLSLRPKIPSDQGRVFMGHDIRQKASAQFSRAVMLRHRGFTGTSLGIGSTGPATREDTQMYGIFRPRIALAGDRNGLRYRFLDAESEFLFPIKNLLADERFISRETIDSWLAQYKTERAEMLEPRFKFKASTGLTDVGLPFSFNLKESGDKLFFEEKTVMTTARIIEQSGFTSDELKQTFAVGRQIDITHSSVQETRAQEIIGMETTLSRSSIGVSEIYWDEVFKNFVVIDAGRA